MGIGLSSGFLMLTIILVSMISITLCRHCHDKKCKGDQEIEAEVMYGEVRYPIELISKQNTGLNNSFYPKCVECQSEAEANNLNHDVNLVPTSETETCHTSTSAVMSSNNVCIIEKPEYDKCKMMTQNPPCRPKNFYCAQSVSTCEKEANRVPAVPPCTDSNHDTSVMMTQHPSNHFDKNSNSTTCKTECSHTPPVPPYHCSDDDSIEDIKMTTNPSYNFKKNYITKPNNYNCNCIRLVPTCDGATDHVPPLPPRDGIKASDSEESILMIANPSYHFKKEFVG